MSTPFVARSARLHSPATLARLPTLPSLRAGLHTSAGVCAHAPPPSLAFLELPLKTQRRLREWATAHPDDPEAQSDLFTQLLKWPSVGATDEVIGRYEELTGIWSGVDGLEGAKSADSVDSAVAKAIVADDELFRLYLQALASAAHSSGAGRLNGVAVPAEMLGLALAKLSAAPLRRSELLGGASSTSSAAIPSTLQPTAATPTLAAASLSASSAPPAPPAPASTAAVPSTHQPALSPSALVTALFSNSTARGKGGEARIVSAGSSLWGSGTAAKSAGEVPGFSPWPGSKGAHEHHHRS